MATKKTGPNFLTREEVDAILQGMTARDIFAAMPEAGDKVNGSQIASEAFESAAERQGHGPGALDRVRPADGLYLASELGEVLSVDSPKADGTDPLQLSRDSGDSPLS